MLAKQRLVGVSGQPFAFRPFLAMVAARSVFSVLGFAPNSSKPFNSLFYSGSKAF
jgi:hypothetical protein